MHRLLSLSGLLALVAALVAVPGAQAHAVITKRVPAANAVLTRAPSTIAVTFNEDVTGGPDALVLVDARGTALSGAAAIVGRTVSAPVPLLPPGRYAYATSITSADGHPVRVGTAFAVGVRTPAAAATTLVLGGRRVRLSGARIGVRTLSLPAPLRTGTVLWVPAVLGAPLSWPLADGRATGLLPFPGRYDVIVRAQRGALSETVLTGHGEIAP